MNSVPRHSRRLLGTLMLSLLVLLAGPAQSQAAEGEVVGFGSTSTISQHHVLFDASFAQNGMFSVIVVTAPVANTWRLTFGANRPAPGAGCVAFDAASIDCAVSAQVFARGVEIFSGDGSENIYLTGSMNTGMAPLTVHPEGGTNYVSGGPGPDFVDMQYGPTSSTVTTFDPGNGRDTWSVGAGQERLSYNNHAEAVSVTFDCQANDGSSSDLDGNYENVGCWSSNNSVDAIIGSQFNDTMVGDGGSTEFLGYNGNDNINGMGGADTIKGMVDHDFLTGGAGADTVYGDDPLNPNTAGSDTLVVNDGEVDAVVDCGPAEDLVRFDGVISKPADPIANCENKEPTTLPGTVAVGETVIPVTDSTRPFTIGNYRGKSLLAVAGEFSRAGVEVDFSSSEESYRTKNRLPKLPGRGSWSEGDVITQSLPEGTRATFTAAKPIKIKLVYWAGVRRENCVEEMRDFRNLDIDFFYQTMRDLGCKIDDIDVVYASKVSADDTCEVQKAYHLERKNQVDLVVKIPRNPSKQDLRLVFGHPGRKAGSSTPSPRVKSLGMLGPNWELPGGAPASLNGWVMSRSGNYINNVSIYFHFETGTPSAADFQVLSGHNKIPGGFNFSEKYLAESGRVEVLALGFDENGRAVCGSAFVNVKKFSRKTGTVLTTISGRRYEYTAPHPSGRFKRLPNAPVKRSSGTVTSRGFLEDLTSWWNSIWSGKSANPGSDIATLEERGGPGVAQMVVGAAPGKQWKAARVYNAGPCQLVGVTAGGFSGCSSSGGWLVGQDGSTLVGQDGSTFITDQGGGLISDKGAGVMLATLVGNDGASLVGQDGSTMMAAGGASLISNASGNVGGAAIDMRKANVVDVGGVKLMGDAGSGLVGQDGSTMIGANKNFLVAAGGGNVMPTAGGH